MRQIDLLPLKKPQPLDLPIELIVRRPTFISAAQLAMDASGLEDKEIAGPLELDTGAFSRIRKGTAWLPQDERFLRFFDVVHNHVLFFWLAEKLGYDSTTFCKHRSATERRLEEVERENADLRRLLGLKLEIEGRK